MLKSKKKDMMSRTLAGVGICMGGKTLQPGESESRGETGKLAVLHSPLTVSGSLCEADAAGFLFFFVASPAEMDGRGLPADDLEPEGVCDSHAPQSGRLMILLGHLADQYTVLVCGSDGNCQLSVGNGLLGCTWT